MSFVLRVGAADEFGIIRGSSNGKATKAVTPTSQVGHVHGIRIKFKT